jgi:membrane protein DedA with SNARE-associated domain/membrane-associated phospholipid phosphatase
MVKPGDLVFAALIAAFVAYRWRRLSTEGKVALLLLAAGLVVVGSGAVKLPKVEKVIVDVGESLGSWTYLLVGLMAFAETGAFLGFVAPGEFTVLLGGVIAGQGKIDVIPLIAVVWGAAVLGDVTSYMLGRRLGREFLVRHGPRVKITEERLEKVEDFFQRRGGLTILIGRFLGLVRPIAPFLAGSSRMPFRRFIPYDLVAAGVWGTTFVILGYVFWQSFDQVVAAAKKGAFALGFLVVLIAGIVSGVRYLRVAENRERVRVWIEDKPVLGPVWRRALVPGARAVAVPGRFVWNRLTPGELGLELTTLLAVAGVGAFALVAYVVVLQDVSLTPGDRRFLHLADQLRAGWAVDAAKVVTWLGTSVVVGAVVAMTSAWLAARRRMLEAAVLVIGLVLTAVAVHVTKGAIDRPRPSHSLVHTSGQSFPSGHAAYAMALVAVAVALSRAAPAWAHRFGIVGVAVVLAVIVGLTRIYLRAHYLSDVLAGAGLGAAVFAICGLTALVVAFIRQDEARS